MFVIIGIVVVTVSVVGGFMFAGGEVVLLIQPAEFIVIVGAAVGSLLISAPMNVIKKIIKTIPSLFKSQRILKRRLFRIIKSV